MNNLSKTDLINIVVIGFAIFSMLFGAGNVVFPPYLGFHARESWLIAFIAYFIADIGLGIVGFIAIKNCGSSEGVTKQTNKFWGTVIMTTIMLCVGPLIAFPRTIATTFEMSVSPFFPEVSNILFSFAFGVLTFFLTVKQSKVIDIVGKYLTPILLIGLTILIICGIFNPALTTALPSESNIFETSIKTGYQTLDAAAVLVFGSIILLSIQNKGYQDPQNSNKVLIYSLIVSSILLFLVYGGLCYLGAYASADISKSITRTELLKTILQNLMGKAGLIIFAVVVFMACFTTAIALLSATSKYFSELTKGKISYKTFCIIISLFGAITSSKGLDVIVAFASPILDLVYPPLLVLIFVGAFCPGLFRKAIIGGAITATIISVLNIINTFIYPINIVTKLPMHNLGLGWFIPTLVVMAICQIFKSQHQENQ